MRITLDIDGGELEALIKLLNLLHIVKDLDKIRMYKTRRGYHIIAHGLPITEEQANLIRLALGDDPDRVYIDGLDGLKPHQVLFKYKRGYRRRRIDVRKFIYG